LKLIVNFHTKTVPYIYGKMIDSLKGRGKAAIEKVCVIGKVGEIAGKVFDKVNPLMLALI